MKQLRRLFLFAGFDKDNIVDDTVVYYVRALSELGDVVFIADNDLPKSEIEKISEIPNVLYADAVRHCEYDFGSYKRGYLWAKHNDLLDNYDWVYFVNDSVYGPLWNLALTLSGLEKSGADFVGMTSNSATNRPVHIQSWFIGFSAPVFTAKFFDDFMQKITRQPDKTSLIFKYEVGLSCLIMRHGFQGKTVLDSVKNKAYKDPWWAVSQGMPFVKKLAVQNLGRLYFLYPFVDNDVVLNLMTEHMRRHNMVFNQPSDTLYEMRFLGVPLIRICQRGSATYKVYLFNSIPILKIKNKLSKK